MTARTNAAAPARNLPEILPPVPPAKLQEIALTTSTADLLDGLRQRPETRGSTVIYVDRRTAVTDYEIPPTLADSPAPIIEPPAASNAKAISPAPEIITSVAPQAAPQANDTQILPMVLSVPTAATPASAHAVAVDDSAVVDPAADRKVVPVPAPVPEDTRPLHHRETVARVDLNSTQEFVVGLELGTHCIRSAIAECFSDSVRVVAYAETPAYGVALGEVVDLQRSSETAKRVMRQCAQQANMAIHSAFVGLKGLHLDSQPISAAMALPLDRIVIQAGDVRKLQQQLVAAPLVADRRAIELVPMHYTLEGGQRSATPVGLHAASFTAHAQMITAGAQQLANIDAAIRRVGVYPEQWRLSITAAAQSCISADERTLGAVVIDLGAGSAAAAWYRHGELQSVRLFSFSGNELTDAVMRKFRLSRQSAEAAKVRFGGASVAALLAADSDEKIPVILADGDGRRQLQRSEMCAVIETAVDEFVEKLCVWLEEDSKSARNGAAIDLSEQFPAGVVLIGGGAQLTGLGDKIARKLNVPVRLGKPLFLRATPEISQQMNHPACCCLHGLLTAAAQQRASEAPKAPANLFSRMWRSLKRLADEF